MTTCMTFIQKWLCKEVRKLEKVLNVLNTLGNSGETRTFFNGAITQSQLFIGVAILLLVAVIIINIKNVVKTLISVTLIILCCVCLYVAAPKQLRDVTAKLTDNKTIEQVKLLSETSKNIKVEKDNVSVKLGEQWYSLKDIDSYVSVSEDSVSINVNGQNYTVNDKSIKTLLEKLSRT